MGVLEGKVAIVTGASSGIGERIAELFTEQGATVVAAARREEQGHALEKRLGLRFIRTDVSSEPDVKAMIDQVLQWHGRVDCLINNAGIPAPMVSITEIDVASIEQVMAINVRGVMLGIKHVASAMLSKRAGSIVNISSMAGLRGGLSSHVYSASKGAVLALTRSAAAELGEKGIRVNSISPGAIVTGIFGKVAGVEASKADRVGEAVKGQFASFQPIPRAGTTDDVAQAALYLASDGSSFVNGQDIVVDGGHTATTRGWSSTLAARAELTKQIKAAAESL
ncbi:MAG: glucose 1-dehydrogenase [Burkholderiaceae bacterium]|jgi:NAD(P)-dependent dehydrogenase (short-subunit alcohol dehydrogenase family)